MGRFSSIFGNRCSGPFTDIQINKQFNKDGYVVLPLADSQTIHTLLMLLRETGSDKHHGFSTTHFLADRNTKQIIHDGIVSALWPLLLPILKDYSPIFGNFMVKHAEGDSPVPLHADWTYVDEKEHVSLSVWMPLVDTNESNGCLAVIPASQRISYHIRGPRILQWDVPCNFELIAALGRRLTVNAGDVVIYDHRLLHYSDTNTSRKMRPAVNLSLAPKGVPIFHYTIPEGETEIHAFSVKHSEFFLAYDNFKMPESGKLLWKQQNRCPLLNDSYLAYIRTMRWKIKIRSAFGWFVDRSY